MKKVASLKTWLFPYILLYFIACQHVLEFNAIHFVGYTEIAEEDSMLLYENLQIIQDNPDIDVELNGYTDTVGSDSSNLVKSQARADTIRFWLVRKGIDSTRLIAIGYGEANPVADNRTAEGRALNNRVEFIER
jgi:outer membrane protein OmpA-like peptidoglycan-associated protein